MKFLIAFAIALALLLSAQTTILPFNANSLARYVRRRSQLQPTRKLAQIGLDDPARLPSS